MPESTELLAELQSLRARARADRHGYALPLFLFGALILGAPLLYTAAAYHDNYSTGWDPRVDGSNPLVRIFRTTAGQDPTNPTLVAWYWLLVLIVGFGATTWWYRRRAARIGVETDTRAFLVAAAAGFAGVFIGTYAFSSMAMELYGAWQTNLSIMFGSLLLAALAAWWAMRPAMRTVAVFVAAVFGAVTFSSIAVYTNRGFSALLVIAAGLLVLAWLERSVLLGVVGVVFTLVAIPTTAMIHTVNLEVDINAAFYWLGWRPDPSDLQMFTLQSLILPAAVLLVGGTIAALTHARKEATR